MKLTYDHEADALYIKLSEKTISSSEEVAENVIVDFDADNEMVGIEIIYFKANNENDLSNIFKIMKLS